MLRERDAPVRLQAEDEDERLIDGPDLACVESARGSPQPLRIHRRRVESGRKALAERGHGAEALAVGAPREGGLQDLLAARTAARSTR